MKSDKVHFVISINSKDNIGKNYDPKKAISFEADKDLFYALKNSMNFDKNNDGTVDANEFKSTLEAEGFKLTSGENEFNSLFKGGLKVDGNDFVVPGGTSTDPEGHEIPYDDMTVKNGGFGKLEKSIYEKGYGLLVGVGDISLGNPNAVVDPPGIKPLPPTPEKKK